MLEVVSFSVTATVRITAESPRLNALKWPVELLQSLTWGKTPTPDLPGCQCDAYSSNPALHRVCSPWGRGEVIDTYFWFPLTACAPEVMQTRCFPLSPLQPPGCAVLRIFGLTPERLSLFCGSRQLFWSLTHLLIWCCRHAASCAGGCWAGGITYTFLALPQLLLGVIRMYIWFPFEPWASYLRMFQKPALGRSS